MDFEKLSTPIKLSRGSHKNAEEGLCAMEFVSWLEGLPHSDHPACTCPVIAAYVRNINDSFPKQRQNLIPYLPRLVNTVSKEHEVKRAEYLAWQAIRVFAPLALEACGLSKEAKKLREFSGSLDAARAAADAADAAAAAAYAAAAARAARATDAAYAAAAAASYAARTVARAADAAAAYAAAADAAADAAARAADAAYAAAADAAAAVARAADAAYAAAAAAALKALDGVLEIGPKGEFSKLENVPTKIAEYKELIS